MRPLRLNSSKSVWHGENAPFCSLGGDTSGDSSALRLEGVLWGLRLPPSAAWLSLCWGLSGCVWLSLGAGRASSSSWLAADLSVACWAPAQQRRLRGGGVCAVRAHEL